MNDTNTNTEQASTEQVTPVEKASNPFNWKKAAKITGSVLGAAAIIGGGLFLYSRSNKAE